MERANLDAFPFEVGRGDDTASVMDVDQRTPGIERRASGPESAGGAESAARKPLDPVSQLTPCSGSPHDTIIRVGSLNTLLAAIRDE